MQSKTRLDKLLVNQGHCRSRSQARELISLGLVEVNTGLAWKAACKASAVFSPETPLRVANSPLRKYVSRGALKLLGAMEKISADVSDLRVLDVGQSTGGFTQVLLEKGAAEVVGIDVGRGQLAQTLRDHPRVICLEGINARNLGDVITMSESANGKTALSGRFKTTQRFTFAVMDVSFISQTLILPELSKVLTADAHLLSLVKPQFEIGPEGLTKGGIVRVSAFHDSVKTKLTRCFTATGFRVMAYFPSQIRGTDGNQEYFIHARKEKRPG